MALLGPNAFEIDPGGVVPTICPVGDDLKPLADLPGIRLQYAPESFEWDPGHGEMAENVGIGMLLPTHSWSSGTGGKLSFTADFTQERATSQPKGGGAAAIMGAVASGISGGVIGATLAAAAAFSGDYPHVDWAEDHSPQYSWDLRMIAIWCYCLTAPFYEAGRLKGSRPMLWVEMPGVPLKTNGDSSIYCYATSAKPQFTALWPNGRPRAMSVSFEFAETFPLGSDPTKHMMGREKWKDLKPLDVKGASKTIPTGPSPPKGL